MNQRELDCLKSHVNQVVEIETVDGERLLINVISVFDEESDPDVFFYDVSSNPLQKDFPDVPGSALRLEQIISVGEFTPKADQA